MISRSLAVLPSLFVVLIAGAEGANGLVVFSSVVLAVHLPFALIPLLKFTDRHVAHALTSRRPCPHITSPTVVLSHDVRVCALSSLQ